MLLVKTKIGPSTIAGDGLFADQFIPAGTIVCQFNANVDEAYTPVQTEMLPTLKRSEIKSLFHSYVSKQTGRYILAGDNAKYLNHLNAPNIGTRFESGVEEDINFALRDIEVGEELTIDYRLLAQEGVDF